MVFTLLPVAAFAEEVQGNTDPVCTCGTKIPTIHAANCPAYVAPENPECSCARECTEDNLNIWCDVCGVQGTEACIAGKEEYAVASVTTAESGTTYYSKLVYALAEIQGSRDTNITLKLLQSITSWETVCDSTFTLDLNGQTFTGSDASYPNLTIENSSVTITDSKGNGKIIAAENGVAVCGNGGALTIQGGSLEGTVGLQVISGTITISGGSITGSKSDIDFWLTANTPPVIIEAAPADGSYTFSLSDQEGTYIPDAAGEYFKLATVSGSAGTANAGWLRYSDIGNAQMNVVTGDKVTLKNGSKGSASDLYASYCGHTVVENNGVTSCSSCGKVFVARATPSGTYFTDLNAALEYQKKNYTDYSTISEIKLLADVNEAVCLTGSAYTAKCPILNLNGHKSPLNKKT